MADWSAHVWLTLIGACLEVVGIALVALDFWLPWVRRRLRLLRLSLASRLIQARDLYRRLAPEWLGGDRTIVHQIGTATEIDVAMSVTGKVTSRRVETFADVNERLQAITNRITTIEQNNATEHESIRGDIARNDASLRRSVSEAITRSRDQYLPWRVLGLGVALCGAVVLAAANLVS